ncbi:hypothetical protein RUM44_013250 [Polyplax serrata]|uniref:SANT and BTB domain-containing protein n=1 Tax=Polyplax serrata TaxID=468196 RepID=A0ABR1BDM5_POLSC
MSSNPKAQEFAFKSKLTEDTGDLPCRILEQQEKAVAEISMKDFLDFLKISYQVNEVVDKSSPDTSEKSNVDWKKLTADELINRLKERETAEKQKHDLPETKSEVNENKNEYVPELSPQNSEQKSASESGTDSNVSPTRKSSTVSLDRKLLTDRAKRSSPARKKISCCSRAEGSYESETSMSLGNPDDRAPSKLLKKKLNDVIQEGILDSILPYLLPKQQIGQENSHVVPKKVLNVNETRKPGTGNSEKLPPYTNKEKNDFKRKFSTNESDCINDKKEREVVIHVCDEIKNLKRDFKCSQKLLVSQMGYFAEVTNGQRLEDMDISVHCDVTIFDWLMRWVQKDNYSQRHTPLLDPTIVIPVLMSSAFLQMDSLQNHCLQYCQTHINEIIRDSPNLSCINDSVLTRLANLFSNVEIENIIDKKDKIQSKLYCKLIISLSEPEPQRRKGHFSSVATMYRCSKCLKLILKNMSGVISCVPNNMTVDQNGWTHSIHSYDPSWNLTDYVRELKSNLKTWRKVYWRLWADCHLLHCTACEEYFPVYQMSWCRYHIEPVQYFHVGNEKSVSNPIGRYSCCGETAYRFEVIKKSSGCQYREHIIHTKSANDKEILRLWGLFKSIIDCEPPPLTRNAKFVKSSYKEGFWWDGLKLVPTKQPPGLLNKIWETVTKKEDCKIVGSECEVKNQKSPVATKGSANPPCNIQDMSSFSDSSDESCSSSNGDNSEESYHSLTKLSSKSKHPSSSNQYLASTRLSLLKKEKEKNKKKKKKNQTIKNDETRFWVPRLSTRSNQDNQRDFEERALKQIEVMLAKKLCGENFRTSGTRNSYQTIPAGGVYVKLEQEWREAHCFSHGCPGSTIKARGSASFVNVNSSSFTIQKRSKSRGHR